MLIWWLLRKIARATGHGAAPFKEQILSIRELNILKTRLRDKLKLCFLAQREGDDQQWQKQIYT